MAEVIVAGALFVAPDERDSYLAGCRELITMARDAGGCLDFHLSADPLEPGRINVFEHWASLAAAESFRGSGPSGAQQAQILDARILQHEVSATQTL
jgi:quinol monooxygenase YgiN